jgi:MoxR-like ATPase
MGYPSAAEEANILKARRGDNPLSHISAITDIESIRAMREYVGTIRIDDELYDYIVALISATRKHPQLALGASPRASLALKRLCQAYAFMHSRNYVIPEDVSDIFRVAVAHRLVLGQEAKLHQITCDTVIDEILRQTPVPFKGKR